MNGLVYPIKAVENIKDIWTTEDLLFPANVTPNMLELNDLTDDAICHGCTNSHALLIYSRQSDVFRQLQLLMMQLKVSVDDMKCRKRVTIDFLFLS